MNFMRNILRSSLASILVVALSACGTAEAPDESKKEEINPRFSAVEDSIRELPEENNPTNEPIAAETSALHPDDTWPGLLMSDAGPDLESSWLNPLEITGDYEADLRNVGFDPPASEFEEVVTYHEENLCEPSFTDELERLSYLGLLNAELAYDRVDWIRVIILYKCPGRAETVDRLFIFLEKNAEE